MACTHMASTVCVRVDGQRVIGERHGAGRAGGEDEPVCTHPNLAPHADALQKAFGVMVAPLVFLTGEVHGDHLVLHGEEGARHVGLSGAAERLDPVDGMAGEVQLTAAGFQRFGVGPRGLLTQLGPLGTPLFWA